MAKKKDEKKSKGRKKGAKPVPVLVGCVQLIIEAVDESKGLREEGAPDPHAHFKSELRVGHHGRDPILPEQPDLKKARWVYELRTSESGGVVHLSDTDTGWKTQSAVDLTKSRTLQFIFVDCKPT